MTIRIRTQGSNQGPQYKVVYNGPDSDVEVELFTRSASSITDEVIKTVVLNYKLLHHDVNIGCDLGATVSGIFADRLRTSGEVAAILNSLGQRGRCGYKPETNCREGNFRAQ